MKDLENPCTDEHHALVVANFNHESNSKFCADQFYLGNCFCSGKKQCSTNDKCNRKFVNTKVTNPETEFKPSERAKAHFCERCLKRKQKGLMKEDEEFFVLCHPCYNAAVGLACRADVSPSKRRQKRQKKMHSPTKSTAS